MSLGTMPVPAPDPTSPAAQPALSLRPSPTDPEQRHKVLDDFAAKLSAMSSLLDSRSRTLSASEAQLHTQRKALHSQQLRLHDVETSTRTELAALISDLTTRARANAAREDALRTAHAALVSNFANARATLAEADTAAKRLPSRKRQLRDLDKKLATKTALLAEADAALADATIQRDDAVNATATLMRDRDRLRAAAARLEALDASLTTRDASIKERESTLIRYAALERAIPALQALLDEPLPSLHVGETDKPSIVSDGIPPTSGSGARDNSATLGHQHQDATCNPTDAARVVLARLSEIRALNTQLAARAAALSARAAVLSEKENAHTRRETEVAESARRSGAAVESARRLQNAAQAAQADAERATAAAAAREDAIRRREVEVDTTADALATREAAADAKDAALTRREAALNRALAAVQQREDAAERRERRAAAEAQAARRAMRETTARESLLDARELELQARARPRESTAQNIVSSDVVEGLEAMPVRPAQTQTTGEGVRRALSFETGRPSRTSTRPYVQEQQHQGVSEYNQEQQARQSVGGERQQGKEQSREDESGEESEAAAQELYGELLGVRSVWRERVEQLKNAVEKLRATARPRTQRHVGDALRAVAAGLNAVQQELDMPVPGSNALASGGGAIEPGFRRLLFTQEQARHNTWRARLKEFFTVVQEVEGGMMLHQQAQAEETSRSASTATSRQTEQSQSRSRSWSPSRTGSRSTRSVSQSASQSGDSTSRGESSQRDPEPLPVNTRGARRDDTTPDFADNVNDGYDDESESVTVSSRGRAGVSEDGAPVAGATGWPVDSGGSSDRSVDGTVDATLTLRGGPGRNMFAVPTMDNTGGNMRPSVRELFGLSGWGGGTLRGDGEDSALTGLGLASPDEAVLTGHPRTRATGVIGGIPAGVVLGGTGFFSGGQSSSARLAQELPRLANAGYEYVDKEIAERIERIGERTVQDEVSAGEQATVREGLQSVVDELNAVQVSAMQAMGGDLGS